MENFIFCVVLSFKASLSSLSRSDYSGTILENYFSPTRERELPMKLGCTGSCEQMYNPGMVH